MTPAPAARDAGTAAGNTPVAWLRLYDRWRILPLMVVLAGLAVLPARTWLTQRQSMADARTELEQVEADVADLSRQLEELQTDDEIERMAREHFDLVYPGEESYRIVPADPSTD